MSSKRPHRKTRTGCDTCKRRHLKCDGQRPICIRCQKRSISCSFATSDRLQESPHTVSQPGMSDISKPEREGEASHSLTIRPPLSPDTYNIEELELLLHYTTFTSLTMANDPTQLQVWRIAIPKVAFDHRFLMYGLYSVGALHKSHLFRQSRLPPDRLLNTAARYMDQALSLFRSEMQNVTPRNVPALLSFSSLVTIYILADTGNGLHPFTTGSSVPFGIAEWLRLLRGGLRIVWQQPYRAWIGDSPVAALMPQLSWTDNLEPQTEKDRIIDAKLADLEALWTNQTNKLPYETSLNDLSAVERDSLSIALHALRMAYLRVSYILRKKHGGSNSTEPLLNEGHDPLFTERRAILAWLFALTDPFITLLDRKHPFALILLTYFASLLGEVNEEWWIDGISEQMIMFANNAHANINLLC